MTDIGMAPKGSYDHRLFALSVLIAMLASYAALDLSSRVDVLIVFRIITSGG
jgi:NO-binding membrane sensor protein with MHYT domain